MGQITLTAQLRVLEMEMMIVMLVTVATLLQLYKWTFLKVFLFLVIDNQSGLCRNTGNVMFY